MSRLSISRAWDETKAIFNRDGRLLVAVALALVVLPMVVVGLVMPTDGDDRQFSHMMLQLAALLIGLVGQLALVRLAIGPATTVGAAISHGLRRFPSLIGGMVLLGLVIFLLILIPMMAVAGVTDPAIFTDPAQVRGPVATMILLITLLILALSARFMLITAVASAEEIGPIAMLKRTWAVTRGHYWKLLALLILLLIVAIVLTMTAGAIGGLLGALIDPDFEPLSLGLLIASLFAGVAQGFFSVLSTTMLARVYLQLAGRPEAEVSVPSTGD